MRWNKRYMLLLLCAALFILAGLWIMKPSVKDEPPWLSFSADTDGLKAWRELTASRQPMTGEWHLRWEKLPEGSNQLLVAVEPQGISPSEWDALEEWIARGNHLIVMDRNPRDMPYWNLVSVPVNEEYVSDHAVGLTGEKERLSAVVSSPVRILPRQGDEILIKDGKGVLASRIKEGAGDVVLVLEPEWLQNDEVLEHSHLELMWPLFASKRTSVMFDETHHGYGVKPGLFALYPNWLLLASIQLAAAIVLWLWLSGKRFGPVYIPRAWTVRRGDETVRALAAWYQRSELMEDALGHQVLRLRQSLAQRWGLGPEARPEQASAAARSRWSEEDSVRLEQALSGLPLAGSGKAARKEFVRRSRDNAELMKLLEGSSQSERRDRI